VTRSTACQTEGVESPVLDSWSYLSSLDLTPLHPAELSTSPTSLSAPNHCDEGEHLSLVPAQQDAAPGTPNSASLDAASFGRKRRRSRKKKPSSPSSSEVDDLAATKGTTTASEIILSSRPSEPVVAPQPATCRATVGSFAAVVLMDSGCQVDVISPELAHAIGATLHRIIAPIHADLGAQGHEIRLATFLSTSLQIGEIAFEQRSFFVHPLPSGVDAILGLPFMKDSGIAISASDVFYRPAGPYEPVIDLDSGQFNPQPQQNLVDLGFTRRPMTPDEEHRFAICTVLSGMKSAEEFIDFEPPNPLLDEGEDDPSQPDISEEECQVELAALLEEFTDILVTELPPGRPAPFRPVNHSIPLLNPEETIRPRIHAMPDRYKEQFAAHANKFVESGWWVPAALESACAMFAVPKHDPTQARFVVNLKPRNANTRKMHSPLPDMRAIRAIVASHPYRTKLDFKNAYEQIRVVPEDVPKTGMATPLGTFMSTVVQQGDCNAPETMHRVCYMMFRRYIGRFLNGFYDDWFVYSKTRRAHLRYLRIVFTTLRHYRFLLSRNKLACFSPSLEVLGAIVTDNGIDVDPTKWDKIASWPTPRNPQDILRFMGTITWMSDHVPHLAEIAAPLTTLTGKVPWNWTPECDTAFATLKSLVPATLRPLDWDKVDAGLERVYVFTDASISGCGGWIGQGPAREKAVPFRFHSAKFNSAQRNYSTTDQELLAVLATITKFSDHLIGRKFTVVCDHEPLRTYWMQPPKQTRRHVRTWETLAGYDFDWEFTPGKANSIADSQSRLAELDVTLPVVVEPDIADDEMLELASPSSPARLAMAVLVNATVCPSPSSPSVLLAPLQLQVEPNELLSVGDSPTSSLPSSARSRLVTQLPAAFIAPLASAYAKDAFTRPIVAALEDERDTEYPSFCLVDGVLFMEDADGWRLVVPRGRTTDADLGDKNPELREAVIHHTHELLGHLGAAKVLAWVRRFFFWPHLHRDVFDYVRSCETCARSKPPTTAPFGLLHPLPIPRRPWSWVAMDFITGLPLVPYKGEVVDSILTVTETLGKMVHLFPVPSMATASQIADIYHDGIYRLHGMQEAIVSDRDPKFTSGFWRALHRRIGTKLRMSTAAHPQTDGQSEATNKTCGAVLRAFVADNPDDWASRVPDLEFAINSAPSSATGLSPFEVTYGYLPTSWPVDAWGPADDLGAEGTTERARLNWLRATDALIESRVAMVAQANRHRRADSPLFKVGNLVYVSSKDLSFPQEMKRKFVPKFVGPYPITGAHPRSSTFDIAFPPHLKIHQRVHASKLRPHFPNDDTRFPSRRYDEPPPAIEVTNSADAEYVIEKVVAQKRVGKTRWFQVRYLGYSAAEDRWIKESELRKTAAESIDEYLALVAAREAALARMRGARAKVSALLSSSSPMASTGGVGVSALTFKSIKSIVSHFTASS
jgi:RNase H-like domain found in reverse transcriptase/Integrase zinc binding domain/Reverse transcriptase (RNA-dependent DNA polymerase)